MAASESATATSLIEEMVKARGWETSSLDRQFVSRCFGAAAHADDHQSTDRRRGGIAPPRPPEAANYEDHYHHVICKQERHSAGE